MIPDNIVLLSFDIVNMYPSIDNDRDIAVVWNTSANKSPSADCIIEGLEIFLKYNNSRFASQNLLQLNGATTGASNSCSFSDLTVFNIDNNISQTKTNGYQEMRHFGWYCDDCLALWSGPLEKLQFTIYYISLEKWIILFTFKVNFKR